MSRRTLEEQLENARTELQARRAEPPSDTQAQNIQLWVDAIDYLTTMIMKRDLA